MSAPQYTHCVDPGQWKKPPIGAGQNLLEVLLNILTQGGTIGVAQQICDFISGGKLICLGGNQCAIGKVTSFDAVEGNLGADIPFVNYTDIDNDFSFSILLAPHKLGEFLSEDPSLPAVSPGGEVIWSSNRLANYNIVANDDFQGHLIQKQAPPHQPPAGAPLEAPAADGSDSYNEVDAFKPDGTTQYIPWPDLQYGAHFDDYYDTIFEGLSPGKSSPGVAGAAPIHIPTLHCEIEGNRTHLVCGVLNGLGALSAVCSIPILGPIACLILSYFLTVPLAILAAGAWVAGSDDNRDFDNAGSLKTGDLVFVTGRWVYDSGHKGWNELHAVTGVQKIFSMSGGNGPNDYDPDYYENLPTTIKDVIGNWCSLGLQIPVIPAPGGPPVTLTPGQQTVYNNQLNPGNRWIFHPVIDGCKSTTPSPPPEPTQ